MKNSVRITGGDLKGKKIPFHFKSSLRPTSSKLREVLFNWIQFEIHNLKCLDLFAGTGSLGIEAISRGAHNTVFIESNKKNFFLNINYPNRRVEDIEGVKFTKQGARAYGHEIVTKTDPRGEEYFWIGGNDLSYKAEDGTDIAALREGYVSVTPLITNYTDNNFKKIEI